MTEGFPVIADEHEAQPKVLLVDDDEVNLLLTSIALRERGFAIFEASSGEQALQLVTELVPDVVVLDAVMNQAGEHPMAKAPWAGFSATTTLIRSDYNLGQFAPYVSDEVQVQISIELRYDALYIIILFRKFHNMRINFLIMNSHMQLTNDC